MSKGKHKNRISYADSSSAAPGWAKPLFELLEQAQERLDALDHKIEVSRPNTASDGHMIEDMEMEDGGRHHHPHHHGHRHDDEEEEFDDGPSVDYEPGSDVMQTPKTPHQHVPMPGDVLIEVPAATPTQRSIPLSAIGSAFRHGEMPQESPVTEGHQGTGYDPGDEEFDEFDEEHREFSVEEDCISGCG